jgi:hypothetical protein
MFTLKLHHNGNFTITPGGTIYAGGEVRYVDYVNIDRFSCELLEHMVRFMGHTLVDYSTVLFRVPALSLDFGVVQLELDQ